MTEKTLQPNVNDEPENHDPSLDHDDHDDAKKGAAIGGIGGAVTGAVVGSMAGPIGTLAGAVIGGIFCAATSKAAVGAIDKIEHNHAVQTHDTDNADAAALPVEGEAAHDSPLPSMKEPD